MALRLLPKQVQRGPLVAQFLLGTIVLFLGLEAVEALIIAEDHANLGLLNLI